MAIQERQYQEASWDQLLDCIRFCQNRLNLRDWQIELVEYNEPDELGSLTLTEGMKWRMIAKVSINLQKLSKEDQNPFRTICHEMIHILTNGKCNIPLDHEIDELIPRTFEDLLYMDFCKKKKIKAAKLKPISAQEGL